MKEKINNLSISKKTLLLLVNIVIIPMAIIGGIAGYSANRRELVAEEKTIRQRLSHVSENIAEQLDVGKRIAGGLAWNDNIYDIVKNQETSESHYAGRKDVENALEYQDAVVKIQLISDGKAVWQFGNSSEFAYSFSEEGNEEYAKLLETYTSGPFWSPAHILYLLNKGEFDLPLSVVTYYTGVYDSATMDQGGVLAFHIEEATICNIYENLLDGDVQSSWIMLENGEVFSATQKDWLSEGMPSELAVDLSSSSGKETVKYQGKRMTLYWEKCGDTGCYLVQLNRQSGIIKEAVPFIIWLIVLLVLVIEGYMFAYRVFVLAPLHRLTDQMEGIQNLELKQEVSVNCEDEIGVLNTTFQNMMTRIDDLIHKVYVEKIKTQEAERETMLAQINPHFLYNTLDSIRWNALKNRDKETAGQLEALSVMLRNSLNFGKTDTTVKQEIQIIKNYGYLLEARFRKEITIETVVSPLIEEYRIPKLLIQPLVENAYKHGLENKVGSKKIRVKILKRNGNLEIMVLDNGIGCDVQEIKALMELDGPECFALKNIRDRIALTYGDKGSMDFHSWQGMGTAIRLILPIQENIGEEIIYEEE